MKTLKTTLLSGLIAFTLSTPSFAQDNAQDIDQNNGANTETYEPAYFEQYAPRTALDMISRIPGYQLDTGDNKRGLGNGGANVLINGARISGKTNAFDQLSRITAPSVVRIEIVDGTSLNIPGLSGQVANVFTKNIGVTGTWEWHPEFRRDLQASLLNASATVSGETGDLSYSLTLRNNSFRNGNSGRENRFTTDGLNFETRDEVAQFYGDNPGIVTSLTWKPKDNHIANLNAEYNQFNFNGQEISEHTSFPNPLTPLDGSDDNRTVFSNAEDEWNAEIGGDYEFPAGPKSLNGKLKFIGFYRFEHSPTVSRFDTFDPVLGQTKGRRFFRVADEAETIARTEYSWSVTEGRDWQLGIEGAFNLLDITSNLFVLDTTTNQFVKQNLPGATSRVEEKRAEATLTHSRSLTPKWNLQLSAGVEYSELFQSGPTGKLREFVRPKGFASATYKASDSFKIRTKIEREVGQLNFFDFISSVSVQDILDNNEGNGDLVPDQTWAGELEFDKDFGQGNTFKVLLYADFISDLVDRIPVGVNGTGDAVGNIPSAKRYGIDVSATLKGEKWGYKGTELNLTLDLRNSSVDDPLTGISRRLNNDKRSFWRVSFRHDIPNTDWAWGVSANQFNNAPSFRLTTISDFQFRGPFGVAFVEHKDIFGLKVSASILNLFNGSDDFRREVFTKRRDLGVLEFTEDRSRPFGLITRFDISGTF